MSEDQPRLPPIWLLFAMMLVGQFATTVYLPGLPDIARDLGTTHSAAQTLIPAYLASFAIAQLVMGPLSDRFGRRPVVVAGLVLFCVASLACALAPSIPALLVARFAQAAGACATIVVGRAMIRDAAQGVAAAQAMSYLAIALGAGPATAPFLGGWLTGWFGWQSTFLATALIGGVVLVAVLVLLKETLPPQMRRPPSAGQLVVGYARLAGNRQFLGYSMIVAFATGAAASWLSASPIVFIVLMGVEPEWVGFFIMIMPPFYMVSTYVSRRLSDRVRVDTLILIGAAINAAGGLLQLTFGLIGVTTPYPVMVAFAISNIGTGFILANCYAQALSSVPPSTAGTASALGGFLHMGWGALISVGVASVVHTSSLQLGMAQMLTTGLSFSTAVLLLVVWKGGSPRPSGTADGRGRARSGYAEPD